MEAKEIYFIQCVVRNRSAVGRVFESRCVRHFAHILLATERKAAAICAPARRSICRRFSALSGAGVGPIVDLGEVLEIEVGVDLRGADVGVA